VPFFPGQHRLEKSVVMNSFRGDLLLRWENNSYFARIRSKDANNQIVPHAMRTEDPEWIGMRSFDERLQFIGW
jgi:ABC-type sulfate transport system substrate-binding protein